MNGYMPYGEDIPPEDAIDEATHHVEVAQEVDVCGYCRGHGADPMSDNVNWLPCPTCHGTGRAS